MIMRTFELKNPIFKVAEKRAKEIGKLKKSIRKSEGNRVGAIGEYITRAVLGGKLETRKPNLFHYDLLLDNGIRVEVKTKETTAIPKSFYEGSVTKEGDSQDCDVYAFCRVDMNKKIGWYLGWITKDEFRKKCRYMKEGDIDERNGYKVKETCWNIEYGELNDQSYPV